MRLVFYSITFLLVLGGCQGSPIQSSGMGSAEWAEANLRDDSLDDLCRGYRKGCGMSRDGDPDFASYCKMRSNAYIVEIQRRGRPKDYCNDPAAFEAQLAAEQRAQAAEALWSVETYNIDLLRVTTRTQKKSSACYDGKIHKIIVEGQISPDSSFAMQRILERLRPCVSSSGSTIMAPIVSLRSGGGLLNDGYLMGDIFREKSVTTVIEDDAVCASSCAVAFLGGTKRIVEDNGVIMYHAPYFTGENVYGKRDIDCEVGEEALNELNAYYREMTDSETGDRLFERTMWYCSAEDGWVVKGGSAAELFGIATEK